MKILSIALGTICIVLIILLIVLGVKNNTKQKTIDSLSKDLYDCQHAPIKWKEVVKVDTFTFIQKVPVPYKVVKHDTVLTIPYDILAQRFTEKKYYNDSITFGNNKLGGKVKWSAFVTMNNLVDLKLLPIIFHHVDSIGIKVIDTCIMKPPAYKAKNHLVLHIDLSGQNIKQFPNTSAMIFWNIKDKFALGVGAEYNSYHNEPFIKVGAGFYLK